MWVTLRLSIRSFYTLTLIFLSGGFINALAQAPNISYTTPQNFLVNQPITPVTPQNKGGAVPPNIYGLDVLFAGGNGQGLVDGPGISAQFFSPYGIAIDKAGNFYVGEQNNYTIREITPAGNVSTYAGARMQGHVDGSATAARFNVPDGVATDANGNVYVADYNYVRKIDPNGNVSTIAGNGQQGFTDGLGTAASFYNAISLAVDQSGNIYVADFYNYSIRKITPGGMVTTFAGNGHQGGADGLGQAATFEAPFSIAVDQSGNIYVGDMTALRKITPGGMVTTIAGGIQGYADGMGSAAKFEMITGLAIDPSGIIYAVDTGEPSGKIRKIDLNGNVTTLTVTGDYNNYIGAPWSDVLDGKGNLYYTSADNNWVRKVSLTGYAIDKSLPPGLTFDPTTGTISGTPTATSPLTNYTVTAYNITGSSTTTVSIAVTGITPVITTSTITGSIIGCLGSPGEDPNVGKLIVAGTSLSGDMTITPPVGFDISLTAIGGYSPSLVLKQFAGTIINTSIYIRTSASDPVGPVSGNIQITTPGATADAVPITGMVNALPTINPVGNVTYNNGATTVPVNFAGTANSYTWTNDVPGIGLPASGTGNIPSFTAIDIDGDTPVTATLTVTPINSSTGCPGTPAIFTITVNPNSVAPGINAGTASGAISACLGSPSESPNIEQFTLSGNGLTGNITATAPTGFEVSLSPASGYATSTVITQSGGAVNNIIVYVRSAASATGNISGNIILTTPGIASQNVAVTGVVNILTSINPVNNQTYNSGDATKPIIFTGTSTDYTWTNSNPAIGLGAGGNGNLPSFAATNTGTSAVTATITVTPAAVGYAYVPDYANNVLVVNTTSNLVVASIPVGQLPVGVAVSPDGSRVYVVDNAADNVSVIDAASNKVIATISTGIGSGPYFIALSPDGSRAYVANTKTGSVSVINTITNQVIASIVVGDSPICTAVSPDGTKLYVVKQGDGMVSIVNLSTGIVSSTIQVAPNLYTEAISPDGSKLYVTTNGNSSLVYVIDTQSNAIITSIPVGSGAQGIVITPDGSKVYVTSTFSNNVTVIGTANNSILTTIPVGDRPFGVDVTPDGSLVYVVNEGDNSISIISTASNSVTQTITSIQMPLGIGHFISPGTGCSGAPATFTITVNAATPPLITSSGTLSSLSTIYGTASSSESFTVSATNATAGILVTPPQGFEVSTDNQSFSPAITAGAAGSITNVPVYIRLAATTPVGNYSGNIVLNTAGAPNVNINMPLSNVERAILTVTALDVTRAYGVPNPVFVPQYQGFVNGDNASSLATLPALTTTATVTSPEGKYVIQVSGGSSPNYNINPVDGTLTIIASESEIIIPNAFTPNGDGINDLWTIKKLADFPQCLVSVYSRYGSLVFQSRGYPKAWDGTTNGSPVPTGTYYYIINPNQSGFGLLSGFVVVLR